MAPASSLIIYPTNARRNMACPECGQVARCCRVEYINLGRIHARWMCYRCWAPGAPSPNWPVRTDTVVYRAGDELY